MPANEARAMEMPLSNMREGQALRAVLLCFVNLTRERRSEILAG